MERLIEIIKYIVIGIIQGITEIFPISSSGHLSIIYNIFNIDELEKLNLTLFLHLASSCALCLFYKNEIKQIVKGSMSFIFKKEKDYSKSFKFLLYIIIASIPSIIVGLFIKPLINEVFEDISLLAIGFLITSLLLLYQGKMLTNTKYTLKNTLIVGMFQSLALLPGISRSGTTMFGSKIAKIDERNGKKLSFFLLIPISIGSSLLALLDYNYIGFANTFLYVVSFISAFIFTYISLKLFINKFTSKHNIYFSYYLIIISFIILLTSL